MPHELSPNDVKTRRLAECVKRFPNAETGEQDSRCCRFPKPCSPYGTIEAIQAGNLTARDLEPPRKTLAQAMLETELKPDRKVLQQKKVGSSFVIDVKEMEQLIPGDRQSAMDYELDRRRYALEAYVLTDKLADDVYTNTKRYSTPKTWWDMFKMTYEFTWWLGWLVEKFPVKYEYHDFSVGVEVERYAHYPEADIALPNLGRPVFYEEVRRLNFRELEDAAIQKQLEDQAEEDRKLITVYLLVPETIPDLMEETGLDREWFDNALKYDEDFDLNSKIYIIPAGVGYNK